MVDVLDIMLDFKATNQMRQAMLKCLPSTDVRIDLKRLDDDYDCNLASEVLAQKYQQFKLN